MTTESKLKKHCENSIERFVRSKENFEGFNSFEDWYVHTSEIDEKLANKVIF